MVVSNFSKMVHIRLQLDILMRRIIINEKNTMIILTMNLELTSIQ